MQPRWRRVGVALVFLALGVSGRAQQQTPTFRTGVALVTVDVAVFDGDGRPVPGLGADAFEVTLNGRPQPIKVVSYLQARGELAAPEAPAAPARPAWDGRRGRQVVTNEGVIAPKGPAGEDRVFVILVDDLSIPPTRGQRLLNAAQNFVAKLPTTDPVGLVRTSNAMDALNPTLDRAAIAAALKKTQGSLGEMVALKPQGSAEETNPGPDGFVGMAQALDIDEGLVEPLKVAISISCFNGDRTEVDSQVLDVLIANNHCAGQVRLQARQTAAMVKRQARLQIDAMTAALKAMGTAEGIRHLVFVSDGLPIGRAGYLLEPLSTAAAAAGVQVSVLMEEHDMSLADEGRRAVAGSQVDVGAAQRRIEDQRMLMNGLQTAASAVGGQFYRIVGDPLPFFERVRTASAAIYRLGIEPPANLKVGQALRVEAKVKRPGVSVFVNRHALVPEPAPPAAEQPWTVDERLKEVLASGQQHGAVPLEIATLLRRAPGGSGQVEVTLNLEIPSAPEPVRGPITATFGVVPSGQQAQAGAAMTSGRRVIETPAQGGAFQSTFAVPLAPGAYHLRVAVADAAGALGAVTTDLDATLPTLGPFTASDLLVAWVDTQGQPRLMALDELPAGATGVRADLELYPPASGVSLDNVQVELSITRAGDSDPLDDRIVTPRDDKGTWRVAAEFPADGLTPGRYTLRARVMVGDNVVGSAIATFSAVAR